MAARLFQPQYLQAPRNFVRPSLKPPVCLEIGAGMGRHAILFASQHPHKTLIAIERTAAKFKAFAARIQDHHLDNLYAIHADAIPWIVHALPPHSVEQVFILYPNPEPKNPAQRWLNMPFFEFLLSRVQDNATITLASNIPTYLDEAEQQLKQVWQLPFKREVIAQDSARTHFEVKYLARGESCQQLVISRPGGYQTRFDQYPAS
ncbi:SAM-dependent methyltransferase [Alkanindiges sp. WGS2144]|uniref:SAM-dependent methyltransferase n=1 Tax=Alkanindiges sp. WGS2144 TaxID=3366808 RepID=UPI003753C596